MDHHYNKVSFCNHKCWSVSPYNVIITYNVHKLVWRDAVVNLGNTKYFDVYLSSDT